ncbi:hypothetical protein A2U01_0083843, partial [Trifolium medium]|nr:hypothetical protein [Trifolium medium]
PCKRLPEPLQPSPLSLALALTVRTDHHPTRASTAVPFSLSQNKATQ